MNLIVEHAPSLRGTVSVPGDKSITHRALMLGALGEGSSRIDGFLDGGDCRATIGCMEALGALIERRGEEHLVVHGSGLHGWRKPAAPLDCQRSGTTMRLLAGLLAGQTFSSRLDGASQLIRRPMDRIIIPLKAMGADISGRESDRLPPLDIAESTLHGVDYALPMASAQVKSAILLAGLYAKGMTRVTEPGPSRDHTERMLRARGVSVESHYPTHTLSGPATRLEAIDVSIPGDFSSAAYFVVAACLVPGSEIVLHNIGINPTRTGLLDVLHSMTADIEMLDTHDEGGEPVADLAIRGCQLTPADVSGEIVPRMIDEFPILALAATQAHGTTVVRDAAELRVKETDRIATIVSELRALGAHIEGHPDGFIIEGPTPLTGATVDSHKDHRLAMTLAIAGLVAGGETTIRDAECMDDSFPGFMERLHTLEGAAL